MDGRDPERPNPPNETRRPAGQDGPAAGLAVLHLGVEGMDCSSCAATVEKALRSVDGVRDVRVTCWVAG